MDKYLKLWDLKLFSVRGVMTEVTVWWVLTQSVGDVCQRGVLAGTF